MARIPQHFIEELLGRTDIVELIDKRVPLKKQGREFAACCPFHNEKSASFYVSPVKQFYHCFGCGAHGTALSFLIEYDHMEFREAVQELASMAGMEVPQEQGESQVQGVSKAPLYEVLDKAASFYKERLKDSQVAIDYLKGRGLTGEIARDFGLGFAPAGWDNLLKAVGKDEATVKALHETGMLIEKPGEHPFHDRFRERIMFPIRDRAGRIIGFGGRVIVKEEPKYLNSPETPLFHKGNELYGLYEACQALRNIPRLVVVEGYMDVVALAQYGVRYAVATLGTSTTADHLKKLFRVTPEVVFCFDGDRAGRAAAWRALENALPEAQDGRTIRFLFLPDGEDPDTLVRKEGQEEFERRIAREAIPLSAYLLDSLSAQTDMKTPDGRARLVHLAAPHFNRLPAGVFREMLRKELGNLAQMEPGKLTMLNQPTVERDVARRTGGPLPTRSSGRPSMLSPVEMAISCLLHHPALGLLAGDPQDLGGSGELDLLRALLVFAQSGPHMNEALILEHWREDPEAWAKLNRVAQADVPLPEEGLDKQFLAYLAQFRGAGSQNRLNELIAESKKRPLNGTEKAEMAQLLAEPGRKPGTDSVKSN
ncbi:MAG TPA: DNA primase [Gammaproteobacteria bacterium]